MENFGCRILIPQRKTEDSYFFLHDVFLIIVLLFFPLNYKSCFYAIKNSGRSLSSKNTLNLVTLLVYDYTAEFMLFLWQYAELRPEINIRKS